LLQQATHICRGTRPGQRTLMQAKPCWLAENKSTFWRPLRPRLNTPQSLPLLPSTNCLTTAIGSAVITRTRCRDKARPSRAPRGIATRALAHDMNHCLLPLGSAIPFDRRWELGSIRSLAAALVVRPRRITGGRWVVAGSARGKGRATRTPCAASPPRLRLRVRRGGQCGACARRRPETNPSRVRPRLGYVDGRACVAHLSRRARVKCHVRESSLRSCWEPNQPEYDDLIDGSRLEHFFP